MNSKYVYPAIFAEEEKGYSINFPDVEGCFSQGENLEEALFMAEDALALMLHEYELDGKAIPKPSKLKDLKVKEGEFVNFIRCDTMEYRKKFSKKAVKKTLTIPEWLNKEATKLGVNFSQVLQEALRKVVESEARKD